MEPPSKGASPTGSQGAADVLSELAAPADPIELFGRWFEQALSDPAVEGFDPTAMTLATAAADGAPSARVVLLKAFDQRGFVFYTNYESRKAQELTANPRAALAIHWPARRRQVRISGAVSKTGRDDSARYFATRPRGSQLGAAASPQSRVVDGRDVLDEALQRLQEAHEGRAIPCPANWGGYRVTPRTIEFWLGRPDRMHDRLRYTREDDGNWRIERLAP
jgi:pyridoxamine 5'-phosphate oxidase